MGKAYATPDATACIRVADAACWAPPQLAAGQHGCREGCTNRGVPGAQSERCWRLLCSASFLMFTILDEPSLALESVCLFDAGLRCCIQGACWAPAAISTAVDAGAHGHRPTSCADDASTATATCSASRAQPHACIPSVDAHPWKSAR